MKDVAGVGGVTWVFISQEGGKCKLLPLNLLKTHTHTRARATRRQRASLIQVFSAERIPNGQKLEITANRIKESKMARRYLRTVRLDVIILQLKKLRFRGEVHSVFMIMAHLMAQE